MPSVSMDVHYNEESLPATVKKFEDFYTLNVGNSLEGDVSFYVHSLEQLEKFAQDILLQVAALKNEQVNR